MKKCHINNLTCNQKCEGKSYPIKLPFSKIKMTWFNTKTILVSLAVVSVLLPLVYGSADSDATASIDGLHGLLTGQNRAAKPEPFLDRIAALFGGGNNKPNKGRDCIFIHIFMNHINIYFAR